MHFSAQETIAAKTTTIKTANKFANKISEPLLSSSPLTRDHSIAIFMALLAAVTLSPMMAWSQTTPLAASSLPEKIPEAHREAPPLKFSKACESGDSVTISAVGDFLFHGNLQEQAARDPNHYLSIWQQALPLFQKADIRYGNLEGPVAPGFKRGGFAAKDPGLVYDNSIYTSYPEFNYPRQVTDDLAASGITIVSTANNHALDRSANGVDSTIANLDRVGVKYVGTRRSDQPGKWYEIVESKGFKTAWVACTFSTNGIPDRQKQVLGCFSDTPLLLSLIKDLSTRVDAVIVTPHWGEEYHLQAISSQIDLGKKMMDAGALVVIGGHPHVLEPWTKYVSTDGKEHFLIYSMGNFASGQIGVEQTTSALVYVTLGRNHQSGTFVRGVGYVPLRMESDHKNGSWVRTLTKENDQAPNGSWSTWYGDFGRSNRVFETDTDLATKFCRM